MSISSLGVDVVDSGIPGKTIAITMCTHGNEPVGLMVYDYMKQYFVDHPLLQGRVLFILVNEQALRNYLLATTDEEERNTRYVDINMNRIPEESHLLNDPSTYEQQRLQELYAILSTVDIALDLHSTSLPSEPMVMSLASTSHRMLHALPISNVITNVEGCMGNIFFMSYIGGYAQSHAETVGIECGSHYEEQSVQRGIDVVIAVLEEYEFLKKEHTEKSSQVQRIFTMSDQVFFPDDSYTLVKEFANFEYVKKGEELAVGDGETIFAPYDCYTVFAFKGGKPPSLQEAALFLLRMQ